MPFRNPVALPKTRKVFSLTDEDKMESELNTALIEVLAGTSISSAAGKTDVIVDEVFIAILV